MIIPTSGEITIDSESVIKNSNIPKNKVGAVLEGSRNIYYYLTPRENLKYFGLLNNLSKREIEERTEYYLNLFDLKTEKMIWLNNSQEECNRRWQLWLLL